MWITENIELPDEVIEAQRKGELVIFAGAGISIAPPSNLPSFVDLANQISEGIYPRGSEEPLDVYLGGLENRKIKIHEKAIEILNNPSSKPNSYHTNLLKLFSPDQVKIVTTNFDKHFSSAAEKLGMSIPVYSSPAVPLGRDFFGIVQLHGSVLGRPQDLILSDGDFGKAYFTDGWATTFLRGLFSHYVVLFLGYSANDSVMKYFARGLGSNNKARYAIDEEGHRNHWDHLNINVSEYPKGQYKSLQVAVQNWAKRYKMGAFEHKRLISEIAEKPPEYNNKTEESYIIEQLNSTHRAKFFFESAKDYQWVEWMDNHKMLDPLFKADNKKDYLYQNLLAKWFSKFINNKSENLLEMIMKKGAINDSLVQAVLYQLRNNQAKMSSTLLGKWLPVYLGQINDHKNRDLIFLLEKMDPLENRELIIVLMEYLTQPITKYRDKFSVIKNDNEWVDIEVVLRGDSYSLEQVWKEVIQPNLNLYAESMMSIFLNHLRIALYYLNTVHDEWDSINFSRPAIEKHSQNLLPQSFDFIIDHCRDALEFLIENNKETAELFIHQCIDSNSILIKRIAIHGYRIIDGIDAAQKLNWIMDNQLLLNYYCKHEVFLLIKSIYPMLDVNNRKAFIKYVEKMINLKKETEAIYQRGWDNEEFNLYYWLTLSDNTCPIAKKAFDRLERKYHFSVMEHPEFNSWMSSVHLNGKSGTILLQEVLTKDPEKPSDLKWLQNYKDEKVLVGEKRAILIEAVGSAIKKNTSWGWKLIDCLYAVSDAESDLWTAIFRGFRGGKLTKNEWSKLAVILEKSCDVFRFRYDIAYLFGGSIKVESNDFTDSVHSVIVIYYRIYDQLESINDSKLRDTYEAAINHPIGELTEFFCAVYFTILNDESNSSIITEIKSLFEDLLRREDELSKTGKVIIAYYFYSFLVTDESWSKEYIVPLFNVRSNKEIAKIMWSSYAFNYRWNERVLSCYYPELLSILPYIGELSSGTLDGLFHLITSILFNSPDYGGKLIHYFIYHGRGGLLFEKLIKHIAWVLNDLDRPVVISSWSLWLKNYLHHRVDNMPIPMTEEELKNIVELFPLLEPVIDQYLDLIVEINMKVSLKNLSVWYLIEEKLIGKRFPDQTLDFLEYVLKHIHHNNLIYDQSSPVMDQIYSALQHKNDKFISVCDMLMNLGDTKVEELIKKYKQKFD